MRRFEFTEGSSSKFWEIDREGSSFTVRFGRLGTSGQIQTRSFASEAAALKEHDKLVAEKLKKGYSELGAVAPAPAPAPAAAAALAPADEDRVFWTEALRKRVYPRRGGLQVRIAPLPAAAAAWPPVRAAWGKRREAIEGAIQHQLPGHETFARLRDRLARPDPGSGPVGDDAALLALLAWSPNYNIQPEVEPATVALAAAAGLGHAVQVELAALELTASVGNEPLPRLLRRPTDQYRSSFPGNLGGLPRLRALLCLATEAEYAAARQAAATVRASGTVAQRVAASFLFPTEQDWVAADLQAAQGPLQLPLVASLSDPALLVGRQLEASALFGGYYFRDPQDVATTLLDGCGLGAAELLATIDLGYGSADLTRARFACLIALGCNRALQTVVDAIDHREAQGALADAIPDQPRRVLRLGATAAVARRGKNGDTLRTLLAGAIRRFPGLLPEVLPGLPPDAVQLLESLRSGLGEAVPDAALEELPAVLRDPPWNRPPGAAAPKGVSALSPVEVPDRMVWNPGEQEAWAARRAGALLESRDDAWVAQLEAEISVSTLAVCPTRHARALAGRTRRGWGDDDWYSLIAARHGLECLEFFDQRLTVDMPGAVRTVLPYGVARWAPLLAECLAVKRSLRAEARAWLLRHPEAATAGLLAQAFGKAGKPRRHAEAALRLLAQNGHEAVVLEVAARAGVKDALAEVLAQDPVDVYPAKLPRLPAFAAAGALPRPLLADRRAALPLPAVDALLTMLSFSTADEPYAGLAQATAACDPASLARFGWELFSAWLVNGGSSKEGFCMTALGQLGDDNTARKLAALIREWPGEGAHARAVAGLDVLCTLGSDVALMHLNGIALKAKFKGLQTAAQQKISELAEARGLTREELEDRLAPDLGLDDDGSLLLDFGPRQFRVGFDEQLRPFVADAEGSRLKELPRPRQADDTARADAAVERWAQLRKDARTSAGLQILRLELAMCGQRRFSAPSFLELFVGHPLVFHIVRRLVWACYDGTGGLTGTFRVAEDRSLANVQDETWTLPEGIQVGIPHPLELPAELLGRWSQVLGDYEIVQPFPQLGRPTFSPTAEERGARVLRRFEKLKLPTGKVLGLEQRRWRRGPPQDAGVVCWMEKRLGSGQLVTLDLEPGIYTGMISESPEQTLGACSIGDGNHHDHHERDALPLGELDPIAFSELVADLERLRT